MTLASSILGAGSFEREARLASQVNHPNVCAVDGVGQPGPNPLPLNVILNREAALK